MHKIKALQEKRAKLLADMEALAGKVETKGEDGRTEYRAFTEEEQRSYDEMSAEADALTATIGSLKEERAADIDAPAEGGGDKEKAEERAFVEYLRSNKPMETETRADSNWTAEANGATIPSSIANKITERIVELSPVYSLATKYNIGGQLSIPYYDESDGTITVGYADEFTDAESTSAKISAITLTGYLARAVSKVSKRLINNSQFNILPYVINKVAEQCARWIEGQLLNGTAGKIEGLSGATQIVTAAAAGVITADELMTLQDTIPDAYQSGAVWIMSRATRSAIRKLKDGDGNYLLNKDATSKWGYSLFGRPVYISENIKDMGAGNTAVYYGDFSGLAIKTSEAVNIEVLRETYAVQHAYGIVAWLEMDAKIENQQKIAVLKMAG